jgi:hypothetical protein
MSRLQRERRRIVLGICGMICLVAVPGLAAENMFDGVYSGKRLLIKGSGAQCPAEEDVSVTIQGETLTFTDSAFKKFLITHNPQPI